MKNFSISKSKFYSLFIPIALSLLLPSCATEQYYQAESECKVVAYKYYPSNYQRMLVTKTYWEDVPDGYYCETKGNKKHCREHTRRVSKTHQVWEDVDVNSDARNNYVNHCTQQVCMQRYGNADCEVGR